MFHREQTLKMNLSRTCGKINFISHPIFFIYWQKLKVTYISVQTITIDYIKPIIIGYNILTLIKTDKYFNRREKRRKKKTKFTKRQR